MRDLESCEGLGYLERGARDARHDGVAISPAIGAVVESLDDDPLLASHPPLEADDDLAGLKAA